MILYASYESNKWRYITEEGTSWIPQAGKHQVILQLKDCPVYSLHLPPVKAKDLVQLIAGQIPSLYPGEVEEITWDYISYGNETLVFLIKNSMLESLLQDLGENIEIFSAAHFLEKPKGLGIYSLETPLGWELLFIGESGLDHAIHLSKNEFSQKNAFIRDFKESMDGQDLLECPLKFRPILKGLFLKKEKNPKVRLFLTTGLLALVIFSLTLFPLIRNKQLKAELLQLEDQNRSLQSLNENNAYITQWNHLKAELKKEIPQDRYEFLQLLFSVFRYRGIILKITIKGDEFQIQGESRNALTLTEQLQGLESLEEVTLHRISRINNMERFTLSGRIR